MLSLLLVLLTLQSIALVDALQSAAGTVSAKFSLSACWEFSLQA